MTPSAGKFYGKVDELEEAIYSETRRKTRQRLSIIGISTLILVAIIVTAVVATNHGSSEDKPNPSTPSDSLSKSIKAICDATLYPSSCLSTLAPMINTTTTTTTTTSLDPTKLFFFSVEAAMSELSKASKAFEELAQKAAVDKMSFAALKDCNELIDLAIDHLNDSLSTPDISSGDVVDDLKTWLSGSITDQHTCIDGLANSNDELKTSVHDAMKNSTELTSNSLAILSEISNFIGSIKLRRLMIHYEDTDWSPSWLSSKDRRLLESSSDAQKKADIVVAKDGSSKYKTIEAALKAVPEKSKKRFIIYIKKGTYSENVSIDKNKWNVFMIGDGKNATIVSGSLNFIDGTSTFQSATFAVLGKGFMARDMGFENTAGPQKHQAVAMMSHADQSVFYRCSFKANQDTLYVHSLRQFYRECDVYGTVDFIFGNAAVVLQNCNILPRRPMAGQQDTITAQGKVDPNQNTGIVIHNCSVWPFGNLTSVRVYLGRPWKPYSTTLFIKSTLASFIDPSGWLPWTGNSAPDTIFYAEYQNFGAGSSTKKRVKWKGLRSLNAKQVAKFSVGSFIGGNKWLPNTGVPFKSDL
ncbi:putative pectinesterase [Dioscorea sansibarensis]